MSASGPTRLPHGRRRTPREAMNRARSPISRLFLACCTLSSAAAAQTPFPPATPESQGMSSAALAELVTIINGYLARDMVVGAEFLVVKNRHTVLHEVFGWKDRENGEPMEPGTIFNVRSMTKPLTGAAAQMLIDEGLLSLGDTAAAFLPGFDNDASREITIEQLLTHRSGLPTGILASVDDYPDLWSMGNAVGEIGPVFPPGSKFWYSDAGTDALGAVVEQVSGTGLQDFVTSRLLEPLQMGDSFSCSPGEGHPLWDRVASLYFPYLGVWTKFWEPDGSPFYPFTWGSQTLYATPTLTLLEPS